MQGARGCVENSCVLKFTFSNKEEEEKQSLQGPVLLLFQLVPVGQLTLGSVSPDSCSYRSSHPYGENSWTEQNQYTYTSSVTPIHTSRRAVYKQTSQCTLL